MEREPNNSNYFWNNSNFTENQNYSDFQSLPKDYPFYEEKFFNILPSSFKFDENDFRDDLPPFNFKFYEEDPYDELGFDKLFSLNKPEIPYYSKKKFNYMNIDGIITLEGKAYESDQEKLNQFNVSPEINPNIPDFLNTNTLEVSSPPKIFENKSDISFNKNVKYELSDEEKNLEASSNLLMTKLSNVEQNLLKKTVNYDLSSNQTRDNTSSGLLKENFSVSLKIAEKYLNGCIISIMHSYGQPISISEIKEKILPKYGELRKINGSKYNSNIDKVLSSTLLSSKQFIRFDSDKWYFKEKETIDYIIQITEKEMDLAFNKPLSGKVSQKSCSVIQKKENSIFSSLNNPSCSSNFSSTCISQFKMMEIDSINEANESAAISESEGKRCKTKSKIKDKKPKTK